MTLIMLIMTLGLLAGIFMAYKTMPRFRFWCFDIWADLPFIGTVARRARMSRPTTERANKRLDELFRAYKVHIHDNRDEAEFINIRKYLHLAGDSNAKPTPVLAWGLLLLLICAESYAFSFLMGVSLSGDMSQDRADIVAVGIAFILGLVLLILAHMSGHQLRRTRHLKANLQHIIDHDMEMLAGEKTVPELTRRVSLEMEQDDDKPVHNNFESQRFVNRVTNAPHDTGSYILPIFFIVAIIAIGIFQYQLRSVITSVDVDPETASAPVWANALFVLIFYMTQGLALMFGYKYGFLGADSQRGYNIIGGRNSFAEYEHEFAPMVKRADESLTSLHSKLSGKYSKIKPEDVSYRERVWRLKQLEESYGKPAPDAPDSDDDGSNPGGDDNPELGENVTKIDREAKGEGKA